MNLCCYPKYENHESELGLAINFIISHALMYAMINEGSNNDHKTDQADNHDLELKVLGHELTTIVNFNDEEQPLPTHKEVKKMKKELATYRNSGRFESKDGLTNHFQVKHW